MQYPDTVDAIDALLPQTQCTQCGYTGCRPYAAAIGGGEADINRCAPGGEEGIRELAALLGREARPLDTRYGRHKAPVVAFIDENLCIGCTLCIQACPVDAIVGAAKLMHTVIKDHCTGCELCLPPCPVDCITLDATPAAPDRTAKRAAAARARERFRARELRLQAPARTGVARQSEAAEQHKRDAIRRAVERASRRLQHKTREYPGKS